ncbi:MAG: hypothetical protein KDB16_03935 [Acidimicrobiales bacterium]|nr:hypothetical protein [Acidimicrobiales bacterium]
MLPSAEAEHRLKEANKAAEQQHAAAVVEAYEAYIELISTMHQDVGPLVDWTLLAVAEPPLAPERMSLNEEAARSALEAHRPSGLFRKRSERKGQELTDAIPAAIAADDASHQAAMTAHAEAVQDHADSVTMADRVLSRDPAAWIEVLESLSEMSEVEALGQRLHFDVPDDGSLPTVTLAGNSDDVVPAEMYSLLKSGKLSTKQTPVSKRWELYQDHVCSAALRIGRDFFALLPADQVRVNVTDDLLNSTTGHKEQSIILSVIFARPTLDSLNMDSVDPSDSMVNFVHTMDFRRTKGFNAVEPALLS